MCVLQVLEAVWWVILLDYKFVVILQVLELKKAVSILALCPLGFLSAFFVSVHTWQLLRTILLGQIATE